MGNDFSLLCKAGCFRHYHIKTPLAKYSCQLVPLHFSTWLENNNHGLQMKNERMLNEKWMAGPLFAQSVVYHIHLRETCFSCSRHCSTEFREHLNIFRFSPNHFANELYMNARIWVCGCAKVAGRTAQCTSTQTQTHTHTTAGRPLVPVFVRWESTIAHAKNGLKEHFRQGLYS